MYATDEQIANLWKWIDALRSGNYPQTRRALICGGRYCCLGVAAVEFDTEKVGTTRIYPNVRELFSFIQAIHINENDDKVSEYLNDEQVCINMNDRENYSFDEIADVLEDYVFLLEHANETKSEEMNVTS